MQPNEQEPTQQPATPPAQSGDSSVTPQSVSPMSMPEPVPVNGVTPQQPPVQSLFNNAPDYLGLTPVMPAPKSNKTKIIAVVTGVVVLTLALVIAFMLLKSSSSTPMDILSNAFEKSASRPYLSREYTIKSRSGKVTKINIESDFSNPKLAASIVRYTIEKKSSSAIQASNVATELYIEGAKLIAARKLNIEEDKRDWLSVYDSERKADVTDEVDPLRTYISTNDVILPLPINIGLAGVESSEFILGLKEKDLVVVEMDPGDNNMLNIATKGSIYDGFVTNIIKDKSLLSNSVSSLNKLGVDNFKVTINPDSGLVDQILYTWMKNEFKVVVRYNDTSTVKKPITKAVYE